ncbi:MAG: ABC transporter ATP-binding protein [Ruminococcaceae bacterium]|nr:ABC transporter ATP-binding protein [Oscillospiraceae bacterium]
MVQKDQKVGDLVKLGFGKKKLNKATAEDQVAEKTVPETPAEEKNPNGKKTVISIRNLHKAYGEKKVLKGLDLDVYEGELFGFIGKNGIGKSTTIDCIIGSKKFDEGVITLDGFDVKQEPIDAKYSFGYVASEPSCYEVMTGYDYLEFIASIYQITEGDFVRNYKYLCGRLSLDEAELSNPIFGYSHGMKQKLCLVASLLHNPKIWMLDEPTVGLDIMAVEELKKMMREYANHGKTVFVTSHNIELVAKICDRVAIVNEGKVVSLFDLNKDPNRRIQLSKIFMETYRSR